MSLLSHFRLDQGIATPSRSRRQGSLYLSSPFRSPSGALRSPRWGSQIPPQYTPSPSSTLRRRRSPSGDNLEQQRAAKRSRRFITDICREYQLEENSLDSFTELSTDEMLVVLFANLLAIERSRKRDDTSAFIRSKAFKDIMKDRLRSCLLSPNLTAYLSDLPENIWAFLKNNVDMFRIPPPALEDPELSEFIDSLMKDVLTKQRSSIKTKITTAINQQMHISHLAKSLAPPGYYEVTTGQWARFAFLRASLETFNELVNKSMEQKVAALKTKRDNSIAGDDEPESELENSSEEDNAAKPRAKSRSWNTTNYWEYVDSLLLEVQSSVEQGDLTAEQRRKKYEEFFTSCLQHDLKKYPTTKKSCGIPAVDQVTSVLHRSIHDALVW